MFNIRNYLPEVINIQQREVEFNIILPRVNNLDINIKAWNICFIICHQYQTRCWKKKTNKTQESNTSVFFPKTWTTIYLTGSPSKSFYTIFVDIFFLKSLTHEKNNRIWIFRANIKLATYSRLTRDQARKRELHLRRYNNWHHRCAIISSYLT